MLQKLRTICIDKPYFLSLIIILLSVKKSELQLKGQFRTAATSVHLLLWTNLYEFVGSVNWMPRENPV